MKFKAKAKDSKELFNYLKNNGVKFYHLGNGSLYPISTPESITTIYYKSIGFDIDASDFNIEKLI